MKKSALLLFSFISIFLPKAIFAQAPEPDLGIASGFALFTASGAINNTGATVVIGDVGNDAGAFNGFPTGIIIGQTHLQDSISAIANIDVHSADSFLSALPSDSVLASTVLGNGQILKPYVYALGAASSLYDTLFLDGQGDSNAVFIFKIDGAFITGTASQVVAINSASLKNVYWQITGQVDLGVGSHFGGTIITNDALIFANGATLTGRGLGLASAFTLVNNTVTNPEAFTVPLSLTLTSFSATKQGGSTLLKWTTADERSTKAFIAERSNSGTANSWKAVGTTTAAGNSAISQDYSLTDGDVTKGINYYRLRTINLDGTSSLSTIEIAHFDGSSSAAISAFPNPMQNTLTVTSAAQGSTIMLIDIAGKVLMSQVADGSGADHLPGNNLAPGTYLLKVLSTDGKAVTVKLNK